MRRTVPLDAYRALLARYLRPRSGKVAVMVLALLAATGLQILTPALAGDFIDAAVSGAGQGRLASVAALFLGAGFLAQGTRLLATGLSEQVAWQATNDLRLDLARHLLRLDPGFHARHLPGELIERVDGDVSHLSSLLSRAGADVLGSALLICGLIVALFALHALLGVAFFIFVLITASALELVRRRTVPREERSRAESAAFFGFVGEVLAAAEDLQPLGAAGYVLARLRDRLATWLPIYVRAQAGAYGVWVVALVAFGIGDGLAYAFGAHLYVQGALPLGGVYTLVAYAQLVAQPLGTLRERLEELQGADAGILRIRELFSERSSLADGEAEVPPGPLDLDFERVGFAYPPVVAGAGGGLGALHGVSFHLAAGHRLGVVGRTGAGKSTLGRMVMRLYDPEEGSVRLGGVDLRQLRLEGLRRQIGYVTQEVQIFHASLRQNLTLFDETASDEALRGYLERIGLGPWLARQPQGLATPIASATLSAGEAQLVSIVRVLHKDPQVVVLDEIASRLDPQTEAALEEALGHLLEGRTAIVIAHRRKTLERVDDILVLADGEAVEYGPRAFLAADPASRFRRLLREGQEVSG